MTKEEIRKKYKEKRKGLTHSMNDEISLGIYQRLISNFDFKNKNISCFVPIDRFNEVITWHILDGVDTKIYLPVLADNYELKHIRYEGKDKLKKNSWGILEPIAGEEITPAKFDFVLVPLLTVDNKGYRVGYGKGYYDKFLAECSSDCKFIGLYQFDEIETIDDIHDADIPLHFCVTPKNVLKFPLIKGS